MFLRGPSPPHVTVTNFIASTSNHTATAGSPSPSPAPSPSTLPPPPSSASSSSKPPSVLRKRSLTPPRSVTHPTTSTTTRSRSRLRLHSNSDGNSMTSSTHSDTDRDDSTRPTKTQRTSLVGASPHTHTLAHTHTKSKPIPIPIPKTKIAFPSSSSSRDTFDSDSDSVAGMDMDTDMDTDRHLEGLGVGAERGYRRTRHESYSSGNAYAFDSSSSSSSSSSSPRRKPLVPASLPFPPASASSRVGSSSSCTTTTTASAAASSSSSSSSSSSAMHIIDIAHTPTNTSTNPYTDTTPNARLYSETLRAMHERTQREAREERMRLAREMAVMQRGRAERKKVEEREKEKEKETKKAEEKEREKEKVWMPSSSVSKSGPRGLKKESTVCDLGSGTTVVDPRAAMFTSPSVILNPRARALAQSPTRRGFSVTSSSAQVQSQSQGQRGRTPRSLEYTLPSASASASGSSSFSSLMAPSKVILPSIFDAEPVTRLVYASSSPSSTARPSPSPVYAFQSKTPRSPLVPEEHRYTPRRSVPIPLSARAMLTMTGAPPAGSVPRSSAILGVGGTWGNKRTGKNAMAGAGYGYGRKTKCVASTYWYRLAIRTAIQKTPEGRRMWKMGPRAGGALEVFLRRTCGKGMEGKGSVVDATRELERMVCDREREDDDDGEDEEEADGEVDELEVDEDVEMVMGELLDELEDGGLDLSLPSECVGKGEGSLLGGERDAEGDEDVDMLDQELVGPDTVCTPITTPTTTPTTKPTTNTPMRMPTTLSCSPPKTRAAGPVMTASWVVVAGSSVSTLNDGPAHFGMGIGSAWEMVSVECAA